jgi:MerR family transcriptional regulator, heat shock protein HspR
MENQDSDTLLLSIGSVARMLGVSVQTLRLYEAEGLILPGKSTGGQRRYSRADVERLECIRHAITEQKIGIAGIRHMQSLVPCWQLVKCTPEERHQCPAFQNHDGGCWTYHHLNNACAPRDCRICEVYRLSTTCSGIKQIIQTSTDHP